MAAVPPLEVDAVVTVKTTRPGRLEALEELEAAAGHYIRHGGEGAYQDLRGAYIASKEMK